MTDDASKPFYAKCSDAPCSHVWIVAYFPMEMTKFAKIAKGHSTCPKCGSPGHIAKQKDGTLTDAADAAIANR